MHARFSTAPALVAGLVKKAIGGDVESVQRVVNGYDNEVYRVAVVYRGHVYVRIRRHGEASFDSEACAMTQARDAGVPVPEVLAMDRIVVGDAEREAMIVEAAAGEAFETVEAQLSPRQRRAALVDLGRVLARLHTVRMPGIWRPSVDGRWPTPSELAPYFIKDRLSERDDLVAAGLDEIELDRTYRIVNEFPGELPVEPVLCHGDLNRGHVFIDADLHVTALIDWGMWHAWSPLGEFAYVWKTFGEDGLIAVLEGSHAGSMTDPQFRQALAVSVIQQQVGHIAHHVRIGDEAGVHRNVLILRRTLPEVT